MGDFAGVLVVLAGVFFDGVFFAGVTFDDVTFVGVIFCFFVADCCAVSLDFAFRLLPFVGETMS